jgi:hypothetical protein
MPCAECDCTHRVERLSGRQICRVVGAWITVTKTYERRFPSTYFFGFLFEVSKKR